MLYESDNPFAEYLEKMRELEQAVKLTAFHTSECAKQTEKVADNTLLTVHFVKEIIHER